jgi:hypothetical protein
MILTSPGITLQSETPVLKCCVCGEDEIPSPPGTVPSSRFFCRGCCELIWIARHIAEARDTSMEGALGIARDTIAKQSRAPVASVQEDCLDIEFKEEELMERTRVLSDRVRARMAPA